MFLPRIRRQSGRINLLTRALSFVPFVAERDTFVYCG